MNETKAAHDIDRDIRMTLAQAEGGLPGPAAQAVLNALHVHRPMTGNGYSPVDCPDHNWNEHRDQFDSFGPDTFNACPTCRVYTYDCCAGGCCSYPCDTVKAIARGLGMTLSNA